MPEEYCDKLAEALGIDKSATAFLAEHPYKGNTDPILYRLHEVIDTYGSAIKDIIHEQGGNAIMSAIDFGLDVDVTEDAEGNHRVIIKFDGKSSCHMPRRVSILGRVDVLTLQLL